MLTKVKNELKEYSRLLHTIPSWVLTLFVLSVVAMNLFANKSINLPVSWLALDCGMIFAWAPFLCMDIVVKHFGPKAAVRLTIIATLVNVLVSVMFFFGALIPGTWGESFNGDMNMINTALNNTLKGNWYIVFGSTLAFIVAGIVNSITNHATGKLCKNDNFRTFALRTYVSTFIGQFVDNMVFSLVVSQVLFGWTLLQCVTCSLTGALCELLCETVFSPVGWRIVKKWKKDNLTV